MRRRLLLGAVVAALLPATMSGLMASPYAKPEVRRAVLDAARGPVEKALADVNPDELSPREALELVYALRQRLPHSS